MKIFSDPAVTGYERPGHPEAPLYPGTGLVSLENCLNYPLEPYTAQKEYLKKLETALQKILDFKPEILGVSAGFDTYKKCPIAQLQLDQKTYEIIGQMIAETKIRRFAILEGGYAEDLPILIENFLKGFQ